MRVLEVLPYATIDLSTFITGDEIGARVKLARPGGFVDYIVANFTNTTAITGGSASTVEAYSSNVAVAGTGNRSRMFCGIPATTADNTSRTLTTAAGALTPVISWSLTNDASMPIMNEYWTMILDHDRTAGITVVELILFSA